MKTLFATLFICSLVLIDARAAGLAIDHSGNLFFTAGANPVAIFKVSPAGAVTTFAKGSAGIDWGDLALDANGNVFVTTTSTRKGNVVTAVLKFAPTGKHTTVFTDSVPGQPTAWRLTVPGICLWAFFHSRSLLLEIQSSK
jgi:hypothetical protein